MSLFHSKLGYCHSIMLYFPSRASNQTDCRRNWFSILALVPSSPKLPSSIIEHSNGNIFNGSQQKKEFSIMFFLLHTTYQTFKSPCISPLTSQSDRVDLLVQLALLLSRIEPYLLVFLTIKSPYKSLYYTCSTCLVEQLSFRIT